MRSKWSGSMRKQKLNPRNIKSSVKKRKHTHKKKPGELKYWNGKKWTSQPKSNKKPTQ